MDPPGVGTTAVITQGTETFIFSNPAYWLRYRLPTGHEQAFVLPYIDVAEVLNPPIATIYLETITAGFFLDKL
jgi:hypothetical protein